MVGLRSRFLGGDSGVDEQVRDVVGSRLADSESVVYRLTCSGGVVYEQQDDQARKDDVRGSVLVVTDRKLVVVVDENSSVEAADIPYTDLQKIEADTGLLHTTLSISVWGRGTLRVEPEQSGTVEEVVSFVSETSDHWQRSVAALQDAREHVADLSTHIENGDEDAATDAREAARESIRKARARIDRADQSVAGAIQERVETVEDELARTRIEAHFERAQALCQGVEDLAGTGDYDAAYARIERADAHLETAITLASQEGIPAVERLEAERGTLDDQREALEARPLKRAKRALSRAHEAEDSQRVVRAYEHALDCYRDALTAGWGTDADFDGDHDALRMQIEWLVDKLVALRCRDADRLETEGDQFRALGAREVALDRYERACGNLLAAHRLARQYPAGDASEICQQSRQVARKVDDF